MSKRIVISSGHGKYVAGASKYLNEVTEAVSYYHTKNKPHPS